MTGLRVLKAVTACAFLILMTTGWVFKFNAHGYNETLGSLRASFGDGAYIFIAIFSTASLVSMPILGMTGIVGMIASRQLGRSAFVLGFLCCALGATNLALWKKYGGMPAAGGRAGPTPVTPQSSQNPAQNRPAKVPKQ